MSSGQVLFEKFEIVAELKKDDYSAVYRAGHIYLGKEIFLKILNTLALPDPVIVDRFKREARILAKLDHPNIIKALDFGTYREFFYISFEYFESSNLRQALAQNKLSQEQKVKLFTDLLEALRYAHENGVIHRDIKPENILVNESLHVKLSDFGLAQMQADSLITSKLGLVGTPSYMSPEQIQGESLTAQSDLFSCGIVACELFLGFHPFLGRDINDSINAIASFDEHRLQERLQPLPDGLRGMVAGLLRKKPEHRLASASAVLDAMGIQRAHPSAGSRRAEFFRGRNINPVLAALLLLILVFIVLYSIRDHGNGPQEEPAPQTIYLSPSETLRNASPTGPGVVQRLSVDTSRRVAPPSGAKRDVPIVKGKPDQSAAVAGETMRSNARSPESFGELYVQCLPWAHVNIDSVDLETTPLERNLRLRAGIHVLELTHPQYPPYRENITVMPGRLTTVKVDLDTLFGYLGCRIYPWGEIFIDGKFVDKTPVQPLKILPGDHTITVKNAEFGYFKRVMNFQRHDTTWLEHRFVSQK